MMTNVEREQRIHDLLDDALRRTKLDPQRDINYDLGYPVVTLSILGAIPFLSITFSINTDGAVIIIPNGLGIGNLYDERPAEATALREEIARRVKKALASESG